VRRFAMLAEDVLELYALEIITIYGILCLQTKGGETDAALPGRKDKSVPNSGLDQFDCG
jgi:hypothetical protein